MRNIQDGEYLLTREGVGRGDKLRWRSGDIPQEIFKLYLLFFILNLMMPYFNGGLLYHFLYLTVFLKYCTMHFEITK